VDPREQVYAGGRWWRRRDGKHGLYEVLAVAIEVTKDEDGEREHQDREVVVYRPDAGGIGSVCREIGQFLERFVPLAGL
jgi:hypothetical protein